MSRTLSRASRRLPGILPGSGPQFQRLRDKSVPLLGLARRPGQGLEIRFGLASGNTQKSSSGVAISGLKLASVGSEWVRNTIFNMCGFLGATQQNVCDSRSYVTKRMEFQKLRDKADGSP